MGVWLKEIDRHNWFDVTQLEISEENGRKFIVPIVYSLAESKFEPHLIPLAIYRDDQLIGFTMYGEDPDDLNIWIYVFMIDKKHQGQGYGKAALRALIEHIHHAHGVSKIMIGHKPENVISGRLYEKIGFRDTGLRINGEIVREYLIREDT